MNTKKIKPSDIDLRDSLQNTFGKSEVEVAACHLLRHLVEDEKDNWTFSLEGLVDYYRRHNLKTDEMLYGLLGGWIDDGMWVLRDDPQYIIHWGARMQITQDFVRRIMKDTEATLG